MKEFSVIGLVVAILVILAAPALREDPNEDRQELGEKIYGQYCLSCHQADGSGVPYTYPPLAQTDWVNEAPDYLIRVLLNGIYSLFYVNVELYQ